MNSKLITVSGFLEGGSVEPIIVNIDGKAIYYHQNSRDSLNALAMNLSLYKYQYPRELKGFHNRSVLFSVLGGVSLIAGGVLIGIGIPLLIETTNSSNSTSDGIGFTSGFGSMVSVCTIIGGTFSTWTRHCIYHHRSSSTSEVSLF